jgi:hypothetical protein
MTPNTRHFLRGIPGIVFAAILCVLASCASTKIIRFPETAGLIADGQYGAAIAEIEAAREDKASVYKAKNEISFLLDRGLLAHYAGDYAVSSRDLLESERLIEEAFTKDISNNFARYAVKNPYKTEYGGEDFESIYVNIFSALNYYHSGDLENALVEIRRLNEKLVYIRDQYEALKGRLSEKLKDNFWGNEITYFTKSALARYLGVLFWRAQNHPDDARIDAEEVAAAFEASPSIYTNPLPPELIMRGGVCDELSIPQGMARLNVLAFTGLSPYKVALNPNYILYRGYLGDGDLPTQDADIKAITPMKSLAFRRSPVDRIEIEFDGGRRMSLSLLESIGMVMQEVYETRESRARSTLWAYNLATEVGGFFASMPWKMKAQRTYDKQEQEELLNSKIDAENMALDLRMTRFLPGAAYTGGINLSPGSYSFTIKYYGGGQLVHSERRENISVQAGKLNLIEDFCFQYAETSPPPILSADSIAALPDFPGRLPVPAGFWSDIRPSRGSTESFLSYDLSWEPVPGAVSYCVYSKLPFSDDYFLEEITTDTKTWVLLKSDWSASFKVMAIGHEGCGVPSGSF